MLRISLEVYILFTRYVDSYSFEVLGATVVGTGGLYAITFPHAWGLACCNHGEVLLIIFPNQTCQATSSNKPASVTLGYCCLAARKQTNSSSRPNLPLMQGQIRKHLQNLYKKNQKKKQLHMRVEDWFHFSCIWCLTQSGVILMAVCLTGSHCLRVS